MAALAELTFARPHLLWLAPIALLVGVALRLWYTRAKRSANRIQSITLRGDGLPARAALPVLVGLAGLLSVIALAGPQLGFEEVTLTTSDGALLVILDTSQSMLAEDVGTSRLAASKVLVEEVLARYSGKVGLVVFEGTAEVVSPLTNDTAAITTLLQSIGAGELEKAGSDFRTAVSTAIGLLDRSEIENAAILLVSDGENRGPSWKPLVQLANDRDVPVTTVLVGRPAPEVIRVDGELLRDDFGAVVRTAADPSVLREIADETGGAFYENPFGVAAVGRIEAQLAADGGLSSLDQTHRIPRDHYQVPLALAFTLFILGSFVNRGAE